MKKIKIHIIKLIFILSIFVNYNYAYEVWCSGTKVPRSAISNPENSENLRKLIDGHNLNFTTFKDSDSSLVGNDLPMRVADWKKYFDSTNEKGKRGLNPIPRTHVSHPDLSSELPSISEKLEKIFEVDPIKKGYSVGIIMPYDNYKGEVKENGLYKWSNDELREVRTWLDSSHNGRYEDTKVAVDLRNWAVQKNDIIELVEGNFIETIVFEGVPGLFYENIGARVTGLDFLLNNNDPKYVDMQIMFQIPMENWEVEEDPGATPYQIVRRFVVWLGERYGYDVLQDQKIAFQLTTYNVNVKYVPELITEEEYANTIYGTAISLLEQKDLFSGVLKDKNNNIIEPTKEDAYSYLRPLYNSVLDSDVDDDLTSNLNISINPEYITLLTNSASNVVSISTILPGRLSIYDLSGKEIRAINSVSESKINVIDLANGIYFAVVKNSLQQAIQKFSIMK